MAEEHLRLKSLRIRGYKVLRDFVLDDIGPLNVVVGPNGCGKSALFEIVTLMGELAQGPLVAFDIDSYLRARFWRQRAQRGFAGVVHPGARAVEFEIEVERNSSSYTYTLLLQQQDDEIYGRPGCDTVRETLVQDRAKKLLHFSGEREYKPTIGQINGVDSKRYSAVIHEQEVEVLWPHFHPLLL